MSAADHLIYCTHRELVAAKPHWHDDPAAPVCSGRLLIDPDTMDLGVWTAECDGCGLELGITKAQQRDFFDVGRYA